MLHDIANKREGQTRGVLSKDRRRDKKQTKKRFYHNRKIQYPKMIAKALAVLFFITLASDWALARLLRLT